MADGLKIIETYSSRIEAELAKTFLESNGIKSIIVSDDAGEMYPAAQAYLGVNLYVNEKDYSIALSLLNEIKKGLQ